ncbi:PIR protein, putative [Plasmodium sp. gorilla clade G1]|nr:PIR protein, putative [Plasmodium sp. gorilla clade G1]
MKVHYINILLFSLPLNILVHNQRNHKKNIFCTPKTKPIKPHRILCECELYAPSNYENDPEMKELMENFNHQTSERFREYDEKMQDKRKQCKEQCDKDIQKIILKDKIEKQLAQQFTTLQTNIDTNDIPTCVCEKSVADKTEKICFNCGKTMGAVAPSWGLVSGVGYVAWTNYVAAKVLEAGIKKGIEVGLLKVTEIVKENILNVTEIPIIDGAKLVSSGYFTRNMSLLDIFKYIKSNMQDIMNSDVYSEYSLQITNINANPTWITQDYTTQADAVITAVADGETKAINAATPITSGLKTAIIASIVAIEVIVLIMVIIYFILRYRRKKKMKKKLQYIKLLKE